MEAGCQWGRTPDQRAAGKSRSRELEAPESCGQGGESGDGLRPVRGGEGRAERWKRGDALVLVQRIEVLTLTSSCEGGQAVPQGGAEGLRGLACAGGGGGCAG